MSRFTITLECDDLNELATLARRLVGEEPRAPAAPLALPAPTRPATGAILGGAAAPVAAPVVAPVALGAAQTPVAAPAAPVAASAAPVAPLTAPAAAPVSQRDLVARVTRMAAANKITWAEVREKLQQLGAQTMPDVFKDPAALAQWVAYLDEKDQ